MRSVKRQGLVSFFVNVFGNKMGVYENLSTRENLPRIYHLRLQEVV